MSNLDSKDLTGVTLDGRFRLERTLGQGGMGTVYLATQTSVGRQVAIKTIRADVVDATVETRFMREAKVLADVHHPNIIQLVDYGRDIDLGVLYFAMEFVEGKSLAAVARRESMAVAFVLEVARQICSGLAQAHAVGVIHRDLKPENVMLSVTAEGRLQAKLLDFGIAQAIAAHTRLTVPGGITGTPHYMSPEQAQDLPLSPASDLYSLGVLMYEMLSGGLPFSADTPLALLLKHVQEAPRALDESLPSSVATLVMDLLKKTASERPANASEVGRRIDDIRKALRLGTIEIELKDGEPKFEHWSSELQPVVQSAFSPQQQRSVKTLPLVVGAITLVAVAVGAWIAFGHSPRADVDLSRPTSVIVEPVPSDATPTVVHELARKHVAVAQRSAVESAGQVRAPAVSKPATPVAVEDVPTPPPTPTKKPNRKVNAAGIVTSSVPPIDDATLAMRKFKAGGTCSGTNHCVFEASEPPGTVACLNKSTCRADCKIGNCKQYCMDEATCDFTCSGGGCERMAVPTAKMTERD